jgi:CubicO group peptidase (beta-lactamase class C family)
MMRLGIGISISGFAVLMALLSSSSSSSISTAAPAQVSAVAIDSLFAKFVNAHEPGCAVLVIKDGLPVFRKGYGVADLRTLQKIGPETNFRLASLTKQFTAMAVMLLVHDGKLHYEDRLTDVFPDFPAYGKAITIRQLLNHTSGLIDYEDIMAKQYAGISDDQIPQIKDAGVLELLKRETTTKFTPGSHWVLQQFGLCGAGHGGGETVRDEVRGFSSPANFRDAEDDAHTRLRKRQE